MQLPLSAGLITKSLRLLILPSAMRSGCERLFVACVHSLGVSVERASM